MQVFNRVLQGSKFFTTTDLNNSKALSPENIPLPTNIYNAAVNIYGSQNGLGI